MTMQTTSSWWDLVCRTPILPTHTNQYLLLLRRVSIVHVSPFCFLIFLSSPMCTLNVKRTFMSGNPSSTPQLYYLSSHLITKPRGKCTIWHAPHQRHQSHGGWTDPISHWQCWWAEHLSFLVGSGYPIVPLPPRPFLTEPSKVCTSQLSMAPNRCVVTKHRATLKHKLMWNIICKMVHSSTW